MIRRVAGSVDRRIRDAWDSSPGPASRLGSALFTAASAARGLLYEVGTLQSRTAPIPVVSVGGLTIGGSGKTPVTADLARRLCKNGVPTTILTHGYADEMDVHRRLCPDALVLGGRDRHALTLRAASEGARIALLDSGFQHRRLRRDLDVVVLEERALDAPIRRLPAGPYREGLSALRRADVLVLTRRLRGPGKRSRAPAAGSREVSARVRSLPGCSRILTACMEPIGLVAGNESARASRAARPRVAVAGVMWPGDFFATVRELPEGESVRSELALRDHAAIDRRLERRLLDEAGTGGLVCTLKDVARLVGALGDRLPVWYVAERVAWTERDGEGLGETCRSLLSGHPGLPGRERSREVR